MTAIDPLALALSMVPHDLELRGMGHDVDHDPGRCRRCRATRKVISLQATAAANAGLRDLLEAAFVYISRSVVVEEALTDGFDVASWCEAVEASREPNSQPKPEVRDV